MTLLLRETIVNALLSTEAIQRKSFYYQGNRRE